jgi:predicted acetyltransferase
MAATVRDLRPEEPEAFVRAVRTGFGMDAPAAEALEQAVRALVPGRTWVADDAGAIVATARDFPSAMTVPGGAELPVAALTAVTVHPTHRRRGLLRQLMSRHLDRAREHGEAIGALIASEHPIYGRFGYGPATEDVRCSLDRPVAELRRPEAPDGQVALLDSDDARRRLPEVHERARRRGVGDLRRRESWWERHLADPEWQRDGASGLFHALRRDADGEPDGYASYRIRGGWEAHLPTGAVIVDELVPVTEEGRAALLRFLLGIDLVARVDMESMPPDDPLRFELTDPRQLRITGRVDKVWIRLVDAARALAARRYARSGRVVLEVGDPLLPENAGRWALEGGPDGAECRPTDAPADVELDVRWLAVPYLGGETGFRALARSGLIVERAPGALARADAMFAWDPLPWCPTFF